MGLADLVAQFEAHDRQTQMVVAVITPETKSTVTVEFNHIAIRSECITLRS